MNNANSANKGEGNMESKIKDDELNVFPQGERVGDVAYQLGGMSLRDYFAAKAMQAIISDQGYAYSGGHRAAACDAYGIADAMLEVRDHIRGEYPAKVK